MGDIVLKPGSHLQPRKFGRKADAQPFPARGNGLDAMFVLDATGSMESLITEARQRISGIALSVSKQVGEVRLALICYRDHCCQEVTLYHPFTTPQQFEKALATVACQGGDDGPEAVLDGLVIAGRAQWRVQGERLLYLIGDAPPHGIAVPHGVPDNYPQGCPCGLNLETVSLRVKTLGTRFTTIALKPVAQEAFSIIASACGGESYSFTAARQALETVVLPQLRAAGERLALR